MTTPDNNGLTLKFCYVTQLHIRKETGYIPNPFRFLTRKMQFQTFPGAGTQENRFRTMGLEFFQGNIFPDGRIRMDFDAITFQILDFIVQDRPGEAMRRNAVTHHTAGFRHGLVNAHLISFKRQKISSRKTSGSGTHNSDLFLFYLYFGHRDFL